MSWPLFRKLVKLMYSLNKNSSEELQQYSQENHDFFYRLKINSRVSLLFFNFATYPFYNSEFHYIALTIGCISPSSNRPPGIPCQEIKL
jgi:hypothetical protein